MRNINYNQKQHRKIYIFLILLLLSVKSFGQYVKKQYLGMNLLELPASTININYSCETKPFFTFIIDAGYTINYAWAKKYDISGHLVPIGGRWDDGYEPDIISGGYIKTGGTINARLSANNEYIVYIGMFLNNSIVREKGTFTRFDTNGTPLPDRVLQSVYVPGLSFLTGFEFPFSKKLKSNINFQLSLPSNLHDLYGLEHYIPGMGLREDLKKNYFMITWNLKLRI